MNERLVSIRSPLRALLGALFLTGAACGDSATSGSYQGEPRQLVTGAITSLSKVSTEKSTYLAVQWFYDDGNGDEMYTDLAQVTDASFPAKFRMALYDEPKHYMLDFDEAAARPACGPNDDEDARCWPEGVPRPSGRGKLAVGALVVFDDVDGDGKLRPGDPDVSQQDCDEDPDGVSCAEFRRPHDVIRGMSTSFVMYVKDIDASAREELRKLGFPLNPDKLQPGFNFARVRCSPNDPSGVANFDKFEVIPQQDFTIESMEELDRRTDAGELCWNWT